MSENVTLPAAVAEYFAADVRDGAAVAACFTEDAVVTDERRRHVGRAAIGQWKAEAAGRFRYVCEPVGVVRDGADWVVTGRVTGDFPGSPVMLRYRFRVEGGLVAALEIAP